MTATKKLIPLEFFVSEFLSHYSITIPVPPIPGNLTGLTYSFPSISVFGKQNLALQLVYQDLNSNHAVLKFEQSLDNINFDDIEDTAGNPILLNLAMADNSVTINLFNISTAYIRFTLIFNTLTKGSFTYYTYLTS